MSKSTPKNPEGVRIRRLVVFVGANVPTAETSGTFADAVAPVFADAVAPVPVAA
jgi:hypothetical protein